MSLIPDHVFHELVATRYMSAAGLIVLLYDHLLTFGDEVKFIWPAPATYAKYIFLLNRYTVLATLCAVAYETCGFVQTPFNDQGCKQFIFVCSMLAIVSVGIANLLIMQRVVILWEHRPIILKIMAVGFLISFAMQVTTMIVTLIEHLPFIMWSNGAGMCIATKSSPLLIAVWASPLLFEIFVLGSTALNALDRPRTVELPIVKALHLDGLSYFMTITCCRIANLVLAAMSRPSLTFLAVFFIWAMTTTVLGRLLLHLREAECRPPPLLDPTHPEYNPALADESSQTPYSPYSPSDPRSRSHSRSHSTYAYMPERAISPFGLVPLTKHVSNNSVSKLSTSMSWSDTAGTRTLSPDSVIEIGYGINARSATPSMPPSPPPPVQEYHYKKRSYDPNVRPWD